MSALLNAACAKSETLPDNLLAARARDGDADALAALMERHFDYVTAVCRRVLRNTADAEEARQDALLQAARRIRSFEGRSEFRTWLHRISVNAALDRLARTRSRPELFAIEPRPLAPALRPEVRLDIDAALARLAPDLRDAVVLRDLCDLNYEEIARVLGVPIGTVRSRIARGRGQLAQLLQSYRAHSE